MKKIFERIEDNYIDSKKKMEKRINLSSNYDFAFVADNEKDIVEIFKNDKPMIKAEYSIIGVYNIPVSVWYWSWDMNLLNKRQTNDMIAVRDYVNVIDKNFKDFYIDEAEELYFLLSRGNYYINSKDIDKILKIVMFITKGLWIFPVNLSNINDNDSVDRIQYILIKKIVQYY